MSRRVAALTLDNLHDLPLPCRRCVFWEMDPAAGVQAASSGDLELEKEWWVSTALLEWGSCGKIVYVDSEPVGFALYAPPAYFPRGSAFPTSPVSADAVLLSTMHVVPGHAGGGLGRMLVQSVAKDVQRRGARAVEAFADARYDGPHCLVPADFLLSVGFKTVRPHHRFPRLRLELRSTVSWREDMEVALERLLGSMAPEPALRPV
jgi:GNAT superfamily N-acetyltransferase